MKLAFDLHTADWVAVQKYFKDKKNPSWRMPLFVICAAILIILNILYLLNNEPSWMTGVSAIVILCLVYIWYLRAHSIKQLDKMAQEIQTKNPEAFGRREMELNDAGISITAHGASKSLAWDEMSSFEDAKDYFILFSKKGVVYIVPKRAIEDVDAFCEMLQHRFFPET